MPKTALYLISIFLFLALIGGVILSMNVVNYVNAPYQEDHDTSPVYDDKLDLPNIAHLTSPHAILVLDVSGSMIRNDKKHLQTEAVLRFFEVYNSLSKEILQEDDSAQVAVVLFSTIAQVINWQTESSPEPWLTVTDTNYPIFKQAILNYLGSKDAIGTSNDPRMGQDTDYLAAIKKVHGLVQHLKTPPSVLFMTDGEFQPHPYFTPVSFKIPENKKLTTDALSIVKKVRQGKYNYIPGIDINNATIFNRNNFTLKARKKTIPYVEFPAKYIDQYIGEIQTEVSSFITDKNFILSGVERQEALNWTPVFLSSSKSNLNKVQSVLAPQNLSKGTNSPLKNTFIYCEHAEDMASEFITVLANWFRLTKIDLATSKTQFQVPSQSQAFALHLKTKKKETKVKIIHNKKEYTLSGRDRVWGGVFTNDPAQDSIDGQWELQASASNTLLAGSLYIRPRYDWVLHTPQSISLKSVKEKIKIELFLYSLQEKSPVIASKVYDNLPPQLNIKATYPDHSTESFLLSRVMTTTIDRPVAYQGEIPTRATTINNKNIMLEVNLEPMAQFGISLLNKTICRQISLRDFINVSLTDHSGRHTNIYMKGIPSTQQKWTTRVDKLFNNNH